MSTPEEFTVNFKQKTDGGYTWQTVFLGKSACAALYDFLEPLFLQKWGEEEPTGQFIGLYSGEDFTVDFLSADEYNLVYGWIMQAADELEYVKPYKDDLKAALEADPRFKTQ
ncbi:glycine cleavage system H protein [Neisseria perflava]|uniref:glycine cleavage system H protein n=1 Tax=Neisseria perflava TaxID=33053 RepID=UPI00209D4ADB|nr:glycine cleavage system H protein [Neisseria perflava]MCP1659334.1 hypothetical protein [Neisseria perflava]